jgi:antitoxin (DNA-binding transcriptional repressor) of toxin-antitoxin stability system
MHSHAIDLARARDQLPRLVEQAAQGDEVILTEGGEPVTRLVPPSGSLPDRVPGSAKGLFTVPDDFDEPLEDFREYM